MQYFELIPAYNRDYKTKAEVKAAFDANLDFKGDFQLGFQYVNKSQLPTPCTVNLRYKKNTQVFPVKVG